MIIFQNLGNTRKMSYNVFEWRIPCPRHIRHILACLKRIYAQYVYGTHLDVPPPPHPTSESKSHPRSLNCFTLNCSCLCETGLYVSRNTYIRAGIAEWKISNPVHVVCPSSFLLPHGIYIHCYSRNSSLSP